MGGSHAALAFRRAHEALLAEARDRGHLDADTAVEVLSVTPGLCFGCSVTWQEILESMKRLGWVQEKVFRDVRWGELHLIPAIGVIFILGSLIYHTYLLFIVWPEVSNLREQFTAERGRGLHEEPRFRIHL